MAVGPGAILGGRYRVDGQLGSGGMGVVWHGRDLVLDRPVAVKILKDGTDSQLLNRFAREAKILARLNHPAITIVHDTGWHDGQPFIVMELLQGTNLAAILAANPAGLPVASAVNFTLQAAEALAAAHGAGVVHRDIKPANLFVLEADRLKVCDFGIAKTVNADWTITRPGLVVGTPGYMSPEQRHNPELVDQSSDLYSLGCVLYQMLTGRLPFASQSWDTRVAPPQGWQPVPAALSDLALRLLSEDPRKRPESASAVAQVLRGIPSPVLGGQYQHDQRPGADAGPGEPSAHGYPRKTGPRKLTAAQLREMGPERAAGLLENISSCSLAAGALNDLGPAKATEILARVSHGRVAEFLAVMKHTDAVRVLELLNLADGAAVLASFTGAYEAALLLSAVPPSSAAKLTGQVSERFVAEVLTAMEDWQHALSCLDAMPIDSRKSVIDQLRSGDDALTLRAMAEKRLREAEERIREAQAQARATAARRRVQDSLMPWTWAVRNSALLLALTSVAFDFGATALNWESWPWLLLFIPVGLIAAAGALLAAGAEFASTLKAVSGMALFLAGCLISILLVAHVLPQTAGIAVVLITALGGFALVAWELADEGTQDAAARQIQRLGQAAREGGGGSRRYGASPFDAGR
jgi:hypothetical protein